MEVARKLMRTELNEHSARASEPEKETGFEEHVLTLLARFENDDNRLRDIQTRLKRLDHRRGRYADVLDRLGPADWTKAERFEEPAYLHRGNRIASMNDQDRAGVRAARESCMYSWIFESHQDRQLLRQAIEEATLDVRAEAVGLNLEGSGGARSPAREFLPSRIWIKSEEERGSLILRRWQRLDRFAHTRGQRLRKRLVSRASGQAKSPELGQERVGVEEPIRWLAATATEQGSEADLKGLGSCVYGSFANCVHVAFRYGTTCRYAADGAARRFSAAFRCAWRCASPGAVTAAMRLPRRPSVQDERAQRVLDWVDTAAYIFWVVYFMTLAVLAIVHGPNLMDPRALPWR